MYTTDRRQTPGMDAAPNNHQSPVPPPPPHSYSPARRRSGSYTGATSPQIYQRSVPPSPTSSRPPPPPPAPPPLSPNARPPSSYYDPINEARQSARDRDGGVNGAQYRVNDSIQRRDPPPDHADPFLPPPPRYSNGHPPSRDRPSVQTSPTASSHAHPVPAPAAPFQESMRPAPAATGTALAAPPPLPPNDRERAHHLPPAHQEATHPPGRGENNDHMSPPDQSPSRPPARHSNPMAMTNLLADAAALPAVSANNQAPLAQPSENTKPLPPPSPPAHQPAGRRTASRTNGMATSKTKHNTAETVPPQQQPPPPPPSAHAPPPPRSTAPKSSPVTQTGPPSLTLRDTEAAFREIEARDMSDVEEGVHEWAATYGAWVAKTHKRTLELEITEGIKRKRRRLELVRKLHDHFDNAAAADRQMYIDDHENEVSEEVRLKEIEEDKERKKDQQRKRRREKAIADEELKRSEALQTLATVDDDEERARLEKEIQRYDKKIRDTQNRLQGLPTTREQAARNESPANAAALGRREREVAMDGGLLMTSFYSNNGNEAPGEGTPEVPTSTGRGGRGGRQGRGGGGGRARKSKEQKQAEKDAAARAQAYLDQGHDLPLIAPKDEERLQAYADKRPNRDDSEPVSEAPPNAFDVQPTAGLTGMAKFESKGYNQIYEQISRDIAKGVPKVMRIKNNSLDTKQSNARKTAQLAAKEARRWQARTNKSTKDVQARAKRAMREMLGFWKRNERDEREGRKAAERQELDRARREEAEREANRQKRKLNFLLSQTEIYSHFIGKKVKTDELEKQGTDGDGVTPSGQTTVEKPGAHTIDIPDSVADIGAKVTNFDQLDFDAEDETALQEAAMANAQNAIKEARDRARDFNKPDGDDTDLASAQANFDEGEMNFQNPTSLQSMDIAQPKMLSCQLKEYQLKGLNWLVNLYDQGINGILADEMGLGKTVQSISVMAYLAEVHDIWGPFLVIAPASTLHNWQQEITKFVPDIKVLPYWGSAKDRKILRKFWDRKHITYNRHSPFHVLVTSYQLVVQDTAYFQKVKWQYMILDEAQAIKSSQSSRWKSLLGFHCRNRLLLTGTPIQNNMQELWALLHFIMPSLFDSHDEFSEWFSKDIENHAQSNSRLNEDQLRRLHMILKPFMLRRIKKHVQKELGDKIEEDVFCDLTYRQRAYYTSLRNKISILDLIEKAAVGDDQDTATLMNLVMQFRKVCNHPDLFERAEVWSPMSFSSFAETASFVREGTNVQVTYSVRNRIEYWLPEMVGDGAGRLDLACPQNEGAGWRRKALATDFNIWDERNVQDCSSGKNGAFSWLRFIDQSAGDVASIARQSLAERVLALSREKDSLGKLKIAYDDDDDEQENAGFTHTHALLNIVKREARQPLAEVMTDGHLHRLFNISQASMDAHGYNVIESCYLPAASAPPVDLVCRSQRTLDERDTALFNIPMRRALYPVSANMELALLHSKVPPSKYPVTNLLPSPAKSKQRYTQIQVPSMRRFVTDSGKLARLDQLLRQLKEGGHRVLLYFQMTRMIDLMEEYLTYRNYKYCRLDGSTKLEDRRDTVAAFQQSPEIFVFLLSTRAGGLGINLTSADTVIFYDSDWNPTIDSQAMDRAHRLGQTRQVTVYRLITRGTVEERIRKRALQKEEVQRVVISGQAGGGDKVVDFNNRSTRENNRTKEMAMWLADDDQAAAIERREAEVMEEEAKAAAISAAAGGDKKRKRKSAAAAAASAGKKKEVSMDDMYHEGEGKFEDSGNASHEPSGAATPVSLGMDGDSGGPPGKKRKGLSKKAKTVKQRLAVIDGEVG